MPNQYTNTLAKRVAKLGFNPVQANFIFINSKGDLLRVNRNADRKKYPYTFNSQKITSIKAIRRLS